MQRIVVSFILGSLMLHSSGQQDANYLALVKAERSLASLFETLYNPEIIAGKESVLEQIDSVFSNALKLEGSMDYSWEKLEHVGRLESDDSQIKVFSWAWMENREMYRYSGCIQVREKKEESTLFWLRQDFSEAAKTEEFDQHTGQWHGKIYYDLIQTRHKRKTFYTLLGADFNNSMTSMKSIEVLTLQRNRPVFRERAFLDNGAAKHRILFEYSSTVAMTLRFDQRLKKIVYDHLVPLHPLYHGVYQFYGPDGSYDAYTFREGIWVKEEDVDARNDN